MTTYFARVDGFLFIRHGHNSQHQVQQIEGTEENDDQKEEDVPGAAGTDDLRETTSTHDNMTTVMMTCSVSTEALT